MTELEIREAEAIIAKALNANLYANSIYRRADKLAKELRRLQAALRSEKETMLMESLEWANKVAAEREACAKTAEAGDDVMNLFSEGYLSSSDIKKRIAAAIRARGKS